MSAQPTIACLIATWRDESLLGDAVASAVGHVDAVIVLDGGYEGVVRRAQTHSPAGELAAAAQAGAYVFEPPLGFLWPDEIAKRNVLLELGRALVPAGVGEPVGAGGRWALVLDADEVLENGALLRPILRPHREEFALGILRVEPSGVAWSAPSRLFRLTEDVRYAERSYWLHEPGVGLVDLSHSEFGPVDQPMGVRLPLDGKPYVTHRWTLRSSKRREVQTAYGRLLAERDHGAG